MTIILSAFGKHVGTRNEALHIREKVLISFGKEEKVVMDFTGVRSLTSIFAVELFTKLADQIGSETISKFLDFDNANDNIQRVIDKAYQRELEAFEMV